MQTVFGNKNQVHTQVKPLLAQYNAVVLHTHTQTKMLKYTNALFIYLEHFVVFFISTIIFIN